jgi:hypothetical protein
MSENNVVHIETRIVAIFGIVDEEGNTTQLLVQPNAQLRDDPLLIRKFNKESFDKAFEALSKTREQIKCQPLV